MKCYMLLRNNQESGPFSLEELKAIGLQVYDLIWVKGKSYYWTPPCEIEELRIPPVQLIPVNATIHKPLASKKTSMQWMAAFMVILITSASLIIRWVEGYDKKIAATWGGKANASRVLGLPEDCIPQKSVDQSYQNAITIELIPVDTLEQQNPEEKKLTFNELKNQVQLEGTAYNSGILRNFKDLHLTVYNKSFHTLESVMVKVDYVKANGKTVKSEEHVFWNIAPQCQKTLAVPAGHRDVKSRYKIVDIKVKELKPVLVLA